MKISYRWLQEYLPLDESPAEVAELLTSAGLEVEGMEYMESVKGGLKGLVVGEVKEVEKHPNADRLRCTKVDVGQADWLPIVCGASNVEVGQKVIVAPVGCKLYPTNGEPFEIKAAKIRGEESKGMICAEDEIGLGESHDGIVVLPAETLVGTLISDVYDVVSDSIFEIGLTPNRADAASHFGVARDLKALLNFRKGKKIELCRPNDEITTTTDTGLAIHVQNSEACPRYVGLSITGVRVSPSPIWLQNRLRFIGLRPINAIVDITNYINHAFGQPLHAFDEQKISTRQVHVKTLPNGTKFTTLDGVERTLHADDLMICNGDEPMCIAGVFGGLHSGVTERTTDIFLESAYFNPSWVRKTSKRHGLHTDASFRFERGIDPNITGYAAHVAAKMIVELCGGAISKPNDTLPSGMPPFEVNYRPQKANDFLGVNISGKDSECILNGLDILVTEQTSENWKLSVPTFKVDVQREVDVMEEIIRIYGYDRVPVSSQMKSSVKDIRPLPYERGRQEISNLLCAQGFLECMSNSMMDENVLVQKSNSLVRIKNPLSSELSVMRPSMLSSSLQNAAHNIHRQQLNLKLFEFGNVYEQTSTGFNEEERLAVTVSGFQIYATWRLPDTPADWYFLKGAFECILQRLGIREEMLEVKEIEDPDTFAYGLVWTFKQKSIAQGGCIAPSLRKRFDIKRDVYHLEIDWKSIVALRSFEVSIGDLPKFPEVRRDLAVLVNASVRYEDLKRIAFTTESVLLRHVSLFDVYEGKGLPDGNKSYAVAFTLRSDDKTLTDHEVDGFITRVLDAYREQAGATLRV